jgi:DNA-binding transcriptional MerR regulator
MNDSLTKSLSIREVALRSGLSAHTLRYYERAGLIAPVTRASGGQRCYAAADMEWIGFLLRLKATHMPIAQMRMFATLRAAGPATLTQRRQLLQAHLAEVRASLKQMQQSAHVLRAKIEHYRALERSAPPATHSSPEKDHAPNTLRKGPRQTARD